MKLVEKLNEKLSRILELNLRRDNVKFHSSKIQNFNSVTAEMTKLLNKLEIAFPYNDSTLLLSDETDEIEENELFSKNKKEITVLSFGPSENTAAVVLIYKGKPVNGMNFVGTDSTYTIKPKSTADVKEVLRKKPEWIRGMYSIDLSKLDTVVYKEASEEGKKALALAMNGTKNTARELLQRNTPTGKRPLVSTGNLHTAGLADKIEEAIVFLVSIGFDMSHLNLRFTDVRNAGIDRDAALSIMHNVSTIALNADASLATIIHEIGHAYEDNKNLYRDAVGKFLSLMKKKKIKFYPQYMNKIYDRDFGTEFTSMAVAELYSDSKTFVENNPEAYMFLYDNL